jgi:hypothetical protein
LFFNAFGNTPQDPVGMVARLHKAAEPQVFIAFLLPQKADLDEVCEHYLSV